MAQKQIVQLIDDIDGGAATQSVTFAVHGVAYEIDLNDDNAASFDKMIAPFVAHARRSGRKLAVGRTGAVPNGIDPKAVRAWAVQCGIEVGPRGRISAAVVDQYRRHSESQS